MIAGIPIVLRSVGRFGSSKVYQYWCLPRGGLVALFGTIGRASHASLPRPNRSTGLGVTRCRPQTKRASNQSFFVSLLEPQWLNGNVVSHCAYWSTTCIFPSSPCLRSWHSKHSVRNFCTSFSPNNFFCLLYLDRISFCAYKISQHSLIHQRLLRMSLPVTFYRFWFVFLLSLKRRTKTKVTYKHRQGHGSGDLIG